MSTEQTTDVVEKIGDKLVQYMDAAESIVTQYAGDAAELGLMVFRIQAMGEVVTPLILLVTLVIVAIIIYKRFCGPTRMSKDALISLIDRGYGGRSSNQDSIVKAFTGNSGCNSVTTQIQNGPDMCETLAWTEARIVSSVICGLCTLGAVLALIHVLNIWAWVGMFYPEAYAVHLLLLK